MTGLEPAGWDIRGIRAANPGPLTLSGTNTWLAGRAPTWLIDPGPALPEHLEAVAREIEGRGGLGGVALTHDHADHAESVPRIRELYPGAPVGAARGRAVVELGDGSSFGPLTAVSTPGHAPDHLAYLFGRAAFTGDAVLGAGSVFVDPYPGALAAYLEGLARLRRHAPEIILPGHGPVVEDPEERLQQYVSHRLERERRLVRALDEGRRTVDELLDAAWDDVPAQLRLPASWTLAAHLDKLEAEGCLPDGVQRPQLDRLGVES